MDMETFQDSGRNEGSARGAGTGDTCRGHDCPGSCADGRRGRQGRQRPPGLWLSYEEYLQIPTYLRWGRSLSWGGRG